MVEARSEFQEPLLVERLAELFGFEFLSAKLPGPDIYPPYLFAAAFLFVDHGIVNVIIHFTGGTHVLIDFPNIIAGPPAVLLAAFGLRCLLTGASRPFARAEAAAPPRGLRRPGRPERAAPVGPPRREPHTSPAYCASRSLRSL